MPVSKEQPMVGSQQEMCKAVLTPVVRIVDFDSTAIRLRYTTIRRLRSGLPVCVHCDLNK